MSRQAGLVTGLGLVYVSETRSGSAGLPGSFLDETSVPAASVVLAATEAKDIASVAVHYGPAPLHAALASTEAPDRASVAVTVPVHVFVKLAASEAPDWASFDITRFAYLAALRASEWPDIASVNILAGVDVIALKTTEAPDTAAVHIGLGPLPTRLAVAASETPDIAAAVVHLGMGVALVASEAPDVASIAVSASIYEIALVASEAPDIAAVSLQLIVDLHLTASEKPDRAYCRVYNSEAFDFAGPIPWQPGPWYFAWADQSETTFIPSVHCRWDETVFSFEYTHEEGQSAHLKLTIKNPRVPLLGAGRQSWAWFSKDIDGVPTPRGFFRLIAAPTDVAAEKITLQFTAMPLDLIFQKRRMAEQLMVAPYWDPAFIEEARRLDPDSVMEGYSASWHIDPVSLQVTISDWIEGEDGAVAFSASDAIYESLKTSIEQPPLKNVVVYLSAGWEQHDIGTIPFGYRTWTSEAAAGMAGSWPKAGAAVSQGWTVKHANAEDLAGPLFSGSWSGSWKNDQKIHGNGDTMSISFSVSTCWLATPTHVSSYAFSTNPPPGFSGPPGDDSAGFSPPTQGVIQSFITNENFVDIPNDPVIGQAGSYNLSIAMTLFFGWQVQTYLVMGYEAKRQHNEQVRFTLTADLQPMFTDPGGIAADFAQDSELIKLDGKVGQEGPYGPYVGNWQPNTFYNEQDVISVLENGYWYGYQVTRDHLSLPNFDPEICAGQFVPGQWVDAGTMVYHNGAYFNVLISGAWTIAPSPNVAECLDPYYQHPIFVLTIQPRSGSRVYSPINNFRGFWNPGMVLIPQDIVVAPDGNWYQVAIGHVADAVFDFYDCDVTGALYYQMMLNPPPIGDVRSSTYFPTDRGAWSIQYALMRARARLINRARAVTVSYDVLGDMAWTMTLRQSAQFADARLPGGQVVGKISKLEIKGDSKTPASYRGTVTIKPIAGTDAAAPSADDGTPGYVEDDYIVPAYTYRDGAQVVANPADAWGMIGYSQPAPIVYDDGLVFPLDYNHAVVSEVAQTYLDPTKFEAGTLVTSFSDPNIWTAVKYQIQNYQASITATQTWYILTLNPVQNGPFSAQWTLDTTPLPLPNQISISQ